MFSSRYERLAATVIAVYAAVWLGCFLTLPGFYLDTYEMFAFGREMQLGYWKHPPLPPWLAELGLLVTGGWPQSQYVLAVGAAVLALIYLFRLTRDMAGVQLALVAVGLTMVNYYFTRPIETLNHNIVQLPLWAMVAFYFRRAFLDDRWPAWVLLGLTSALLIYAKYTGAILLVMLAVFAVAAPEYRRRMASAGPWLAVAVCLVLLLPHLYWLVENDFLPFRYPFDSTSRLSGAIDRLASTLSFLLAQVAFHLAMLIVLAIALVGWGRRKSLELSAKDKTPSDIWLMLVVGVLPILVVALSSLWSGSSVRSEVGGSLVALSGLVIVMLLPRPVQLRWPRLAIAVWAIIMLGAPIGWRISLESRAASGDVPLEMRDDRGLSTMMQAVWAERTTAPLKIVIGHFVDAAAVALYAETRPSVLIDFDYGHSPWVTPERLDQEGALAVWSQGKRGRGALEAVRSIAGDRHWEAGGPIELAGSGAGTNYEWAIIYPATAAEDRR